MSWFEWLGLALLTLSILGWLSYKFAFSLYLRVVKGMGIREKGEDSIPVYPMS